VEEEVVEAVAEEEAEVEEVEVVEEVVVVVAEASGEVVEEEVGEEEVVEEAVEAEGYNFMYDYPYFILILVVEVVEEVV